MSMPISVSLPSSPGQIVGGHTVEEHRNEEF
jgi:hypothetical protein